MAGGQRPPRIIAGEAGGRRLTVPPGDRIRPTSDRVKESVFSALGSDRIVGARVLDLYAGTGALGLEALSRGADGALLVERDGAAVRVGAVSTVLGGAAPERPFDLALLDPPYDLSEDDLAAVLVLLDGGGWLAADATVMVERSASSPAPRWPHGWGSTWERCYGDTLVLFAQRK